MINILKNIRQMLNEERQNTNSNELERYNKRKSEIFEQYGDVSPNKKIILSNEEIEEIHKRGHLTPEDKANEWMRMDLCAPGDAIGSGANRCYYFDFDCYECLLDLASIQKEHESFNYTLKKTLNRK